MGIEIRWCGRRGEEAKDGRQVNGKEVVM